MRQPRPSTRSNINIAKNKTQNRKGSNPKRKNSNKPNGVNLNLPKIISSAVAAGLRKGGAAVGGWAGGPAGAMLGHAAGAGLSRVIGTGDYVVSGNSIISNSAVPDFSRGKRSIRIRHAEYLGDVTSSVAFAVQSFILNPGISATFPWLSAIAANFQQYKIHGLLFEFKSTAAFAVNNANVALGTLIMSTQYNVGRPNFSSKLEMESYEFCTSGRPTETMLHPVECASGEAPLKELYVRNGAVPDGEDARFYDYAKFQLATVGVQQASNVGELWITYDIELFKPRVQPGGSTPGLFTKIANGAYSNAQPLGLIQTIPLGNLGLSVLAGYTTLFWPASYTTGRYLINLVWQGGSTAVTVVTPTFTNLTRQGAYYLDSQTEMFVPVSGVTTTRVSYSCIVTINGYSAAGSSINFGTTMTLPAPANVVDIIVVSLPLVNDYV